MISHHCPAGECVHSLRGAVAPLVAAFVVFHRFRPLFSAGDTCAYPFVFQRISEPVGIISAVPEQPVDVRQAGQQCPCADVVADLTGRDEQVERSALVVADGMQLGVHAALGPANQASTSPFFTPKLVAVRWALR